MTLRNQALLGLLICLLAALLICGCTQQPVVPAPTPTPTATPTPETTAGLPNPASVYCGQVGGTLEIMKNPDGSEYGMCNFPNGTSCEEWALYRGEGCQPAPTAPPTSEPTAGMPNPASVYCGQVGGTLEIMKNPDGSEYGMCNFPNGTSCEEWALYRGEGCQPGAVIGMPNPASVYCGQVGGTLEIVKNPDGSEYGMCNFPNGTSCEEWALYRGEGCKA